MPNPYTESLQKWLQIYAQEVRSQPEADIRDNLQMVLAEVERRNDDLFLSMVLGQHIVPPLIAATKSLRRLADQMRQNGGTVPQRHKELVYELQLVLQSFVILFMREFFKTPERPAPDPQDVQ